VSSGLRSLPVPDGLAGERVDAGLSRLLGISRTRAADLASAGLVLLDGAPAGKSDRLTAGAWLEVDVDSLVEAATAAAARG
jgi:23S rRNA pseudouridine1911/1915/1917 synthase